MKTGIIRLILIAASLLIGSVTAVQAQVQPAQEPCDTDYYDSLEARAWLEAQREITQNQNLIFKPDSVLEYTCFDKYLDVLADKAEVPLFSENQTRWGQILSTTSMDTALNELVGKPNIDYNKANFDHTALGDRLSSKNNKTDLDYTPDSVSGGSYSCDMMKKIWMQAKCLDFIDNQDEDGFFTFKEYQQDPDKRFLPDRCDPESRWQENIDLATVDPKTKWKEDDVKTYLDRLDPENCSSSIAIPTGLTLENGQEERVCIKPGCHWDGSACTN